MESIFDVIREMREEYESAKDTGRFYRPDELLAWNARLQTAAGVLDSEAYDLERQNKYLHKVLADIRRSVTDYYVDKPVDNFYKVVAVFMAIGTIAAGFAALYVVLH